MAFRILGLVFIASCCTVQSQLCASNGLPAVTNVLSSPQVLTTPAVATTIVDNSVSNALANALQLFIVSDLIQSRLGPNCGQNAYLNGLGAVDTIAPVFSGVDMISPCAPVEIVPPCSTVLETLTSNIFGGVTETLTPVLGAYPDIAYPNSYVTDTCVPNCYGGWAETVAPVCADVITPNVFTPNIYGVSEIISSQPCGCGSDAPCGCGPNFGGFPEVIPPFIPSGPGCGTNYFAPELVPTLSPNFYGLPDILGSVNPFRQGCASEVISPSFLPNICGGLPKVFSPIFSPCSEMIAPNPFGPFPNGYMSAIGPYGPMSAEVLIPPSIPAQFTCNIGYSNSAPCVNFNVEPLPFDPYSCGCNFPGFYY